LSKELFALKEKAQNSIKYAINLLENVGYSVKKPTQSDKPNK
jgi:hypothetical protein